MRERLELPGGIPSHDTIGRVLMALKPSTFQNCFQNWVATLSKRHADLEVDVVAVDGKALRRSHNEQAGLGPLFLVSAWAVQRGISLGQLATAEKSNEITAIPELLEQIEIDDSIVTIDAAGCQKKIADTIIRGKADYVLALKGNQGTLHQAFMDHIVKHMENNFADVECRKHMEKLKGHGRTDEITYFQLNVPDDITAKHKWTGLRTIGIAIRHSESAKGDTDEVRYFISSLPLEAS